MVQLEPQEKVLVSREFLSSTHGEIGCTACHGGNDAAKDKKGAHVGMEPHPSIKTPEKACGECHEEIVATAKDSLHATLSTFPTILKTRSDMTKWEAIDKARGGHCAGCHTSCGGCHVSRPKFAKKGFVKGHVFQRHADPINQCTACHGSRVGNEFYGSRGQGDVHVARANMDCVGCHRAEEMHAAAAPGLSGRYHLPQMVRCTDCHRDLQYGSVREHAIHIGKVQCQVCHSQTYVNCYSCHVGKDAEGLKYFQNKLEVETMKIGRNYDKRAPEADYNYMLVRHAPADPETFGYYVKDAFIRFGNTPTWKRTSPHNIQRNTWQTATCNHCHGNRDLFLSEDDLLPYEKEANRKVVVADADIPKPVAKTMSLDIDTSQVRRSMVVDARWLHEHLRDDNLIVVDARGRAAYEKGHIEGAIVFDPVLGDTRRPLDDDERPLELVDDEDLVEILGNEGLRADARIVVYDKTGSRAGYMLWILDYAGAKDIAYLSGGIEAWEQAGYHLVTESRQLPATTFGGAIRKQFKADNAFVAARLDDPQTVILDARDLRQFKGMAKHSAAKRAGHIPGAVNLPLGALYMDNGYLKSPEELLWMLRKNGITPDKTIITTCNTGQQAGAAFFILRYLGYPDVRSHDPSWIGWLMQH